MVQCLLWIFVYLIVLFTEIKHDIFLSLSRVGVSNATIIIGNGSGFNLTEVPYSLKEKIAGIPAILCSYSAYIMVAKYLFQKYMTSRVRPTGARNPTTPPKKPDR